MTVPSEEVLRSLLAAVPDALLVVDREGVIVLVSDHASRLFGWTADELLGAAIEVLVPEGLSGRHVGHRARYVDDPVLLPMEERTPLAARRKDGSTFVAEVGLSAVTDEAGGVFFLAAVRDAGERVRVDAAQRHQAVASQAEQSHRLESLGQLAGGVAHDFNNLLGVIMNYSTLVARRVDDPVALADIEEIRAAVEGAAGLTRQLLTFASRDDANPEALELNGVVAAVAAMLARTLGEHIELRLDLWSAPLIVIADRHQLEQIMVNLVLNARDAMPSGGQLDIASRPLPREDRADAEAAVDDVVLTVSDAGTGMSPEVAARAFEPFFTTKPTGEGTGLGLATVYGIVQQSGGTVAIDSAEGRGTTVAVTLRGGIGPPAEAQPHPGAQAAGGTERILLVEDEESLRLGTARVLVASGYEVLVAADGLEALAMIEADDGSIALVITDVVMPRLRGDEMARRLQETRPALPVVCMSGYASREARGVERLLTKPVPEDVLLRTIRDVLDG